jgi:hypothetical protein
MVFHPAMTIEDLTKKRDRLLDEIAHIECKRFASEGDELKTLILLAKAEIIEQELTFLAMNVLTEKLARLFGGL